MNERNITPRDSEITPGEMGVVIIGRNEGERLARCLRSIDSEAGTIIYVDSGSTDQSVTIARQMGAQIVELPENEPFTAAKARNTGLRRLLEKQPDVQFLQFVDGDCEVASGWLARAKRELSTRRDLAVVCGRRRERFPEASIYNRLCDMEWDTPPGSVQACGGDAMMRVQALQEVGGYRASMIAGEEPELCIRLRAQGWSVVRLDAEMTLHDAAIHRFSQWWRRSVRAGHAFAETAWLHRTARSLRRAASILFWAMLLPVVAIILAWPTRGVSVAVCLLANIGLWLRVYRSERGLGRAGNDARWYALFVIIGKYSELMGMGRFLMQKLIGRRSRIIEYKSVQGPASAQPEMP